MASTISAFRYRLYLTPSEERSLLRTARVCRALYNILLRYREDCWLAAKSAGATGIAANLGYMHLSGVITDLRGKLPWLAAEPVKALRGAAKNLDRAFQSFFSGCGSFPQYKRRGECDGIAYPDATGITVNGDRVKLPKVGWVRFRKHREMQGKIKMVSVVREGPEWYVSFACEGCFALPNKGIEPVGLDLGVASSITPSIGRPINFPVATKGEQNRLKRLARQAARRKKGSKRQQRSYARIAKTRRHIARRRVDAAHKASRTFATTHQVIVIEDLNLKGMTKSAKGTAESPGRNVKAKSGLNRVLAEQGHADFVRMLTYKCERAGSRLVKVDPMYTSQTCSQCGHRAAENRESQAVFRCVKCGFQSNADLNAAQNILAVGWTAAAQGGSGVAPAKELRSDRRRPKQDVA